MGILFRLGTFATLITLTFGQTDYCKDGTYGSNCQLSCSERCRPLFYPCDARTGRCSEGCLEGYWGDTCDRVCPCNGNVCVQDDGECLGTGTTPKTTTQTVETTTACPAYACEGVAAGWRTTAVILIIFLILMTIGLVCMALQLRTLRKFSRKTDQKRCIDYLPCFPYVKDKISGPSIEENELLKATNTSREVEDAATLEGKLPLAGPIRDGEIRSASVHHRQPSQIEELNEKIRRLEKEKFELKKKATESINKVNKNFGFPTNCTVLRLQIKELDKDLFIQCPHVRFDEKLVNTRVTQIDDDKVLWNIPDPGNPVDDGRRFQHFCGTSSTYPLIKEGFRQYFETEFNIKLDQPITEGDTVFELGFCEEDERDIGQFTEGEKHRFILSAVYSPKHKKTSLVATQGNKSDDTGVTFDNILGSLISIKLGIYLSVKMQRLRFFNLVKHSLLKEMDVKVDKLWPMFGLGAQNKARVSVKLISGFDVDMTQQKRAMIIDAKKRKGKRK